MIMSKRESVQKKLQRIRPPRVQLTYDVEVGDGKEIKELPFVVGVLGDFSAASEVEKTKLKDKKFKVVRVNKTEFELDNGDVYPHSFELDEKISVAEFQKLLDESKSLVLSHIKNIEK